jgi:cytochrome c peroxidase
VLPTAYRLGGTFVLTYVMSKLYLSIVGLVSFAFLGYLLLSSRGESKDISVSLAEQIRKEYINNISAFENSLKTLHLSIVTLGTSPAHLEQTRDKLAQARLAYKRIEMFAEHYSPGTAKAINGAARDEVEEYDPNQIIIRAQGLQVIESMLYPEYEPADSALLRFQSKDLVGNSIKLRKLAEVTPLTDEHIFRAVSEEMIRVSTLGITGFDALLAGTSLKESSVALGSVRDVLRTYSSSGAKEKFAYAITKLEEAARALTHSDFLSFDRLSFFREHIHPASTAIAELEPEFVKTPTMGIRAVSGSVFSKSSFMAEYYKPSGTPATNKKIIELGKLLFFDPILSANNERACASCHKPELAFTDGKAKSVAFDFEGNVGRNSPTILNAALQRSYFYDSRVLFLEDQVVAVMNSHKEFNTSPGEIVGKLQQSNEYTTLFNEAFDKQGSVTESNLKSAVASFIRSLVSFDSPFDKYIRGETNTIDDKVKRGFNLFTGKAKCASCHFVPLYNGTVPPVYDKSEFEILGVLERPDTIKGTLDNDAGRSGIDDITLNRFGMKTPTIRNIALTAPYMHNGAYNTLEDVLHFYNHGGGAGLGHDVPNQTLPADKLNLTKDEMNDIIAFMHSLTDSTFITMKPPARLPTFSKRELAMRPVGGAY